MEKRIALFWFLSLVVFQVFAFAADPFAAFKTNFFHETSNYIVPIMLIVVIVATAITYMRTKDWTVSLVVGGIAAGLLGGSTELADMFTNYDLNTTTTP